MPDAQIISMDRKIPPGKCVALTARGLRCRNQVIEGSNYCRIHLPVGAELSHAAHPIGPAQQTAEPVRREDLRDFIRRRLAGDYYVDEYGYDEELTEVAFMPLLRFLYEKWWRVEVRGIENVPARGPAVVVANHSGTLPWDGAMIITAMHLEHPAKPIIRLLGADLLWTVPFLSHWARKIGNTVACDEDALLLLRRQELVGVFPEGFKGIGKPFSERYRLQRFGRGGFVEVAIATGAPLIPCAIVGAEEIYPMIYDFQPLARLFNLPYFPITPFFPFLGPLGLVPLPSKWIIEFGEPIPTDAYPPEAKDDPITLFDLSDRIRDTVQQMLYRNLMSRGSWLV